MEGAISLVVVIAGLCSGAVLGASMITNTEREQRGEKSWRPFSTANWVGVVLNETLRIVVVGAALAVVAITILFVGNAYPLSGSERIAFGVSGLVGAGAAKWLRYLYWRSNA